VRRRFSPMIVVSDRLQPPTLEAARWYAIQTRYRAEQKAIALLRNKGVETFLPLIEEIHYWSDRQKAIDIPLFSGYGFVHVDLSAISRMQVLCTKGVIRFVTFGGAITPVPSAQIDNLRMLLLQKMPCALHAFLKIGQQVRIRGGSLDGLEGILEQSGQKNLVISIESMQRSVAIKIEGYELELV
jgi:transcription elongation factor/antiterminator RfaH